MTPSGDADSTSDTDPLRDPQPGDRIDKFTIVGRLGDGGMGVVYEARDEVLDRRVALKLVRAGGHVARVLREARAVAGLTHPNVVAVFEVAVGEWGPYIAMEYVDGPSVRDWLAATPRTWREILVVFIEAGEGLAAAHAAGLVHCDVKPHNILVGHDRVRVADFGLARSADDAAAASIVAGTPRYMAPEQERGHADPRTDQYGLCAALFEALTGQSPRVADPVAAATEHDLPAWLIRSVARGLAREPADRYPDVPALLAVLRRDRWRRTRRAIVTASVVGVTGLVAATATWTVAGGRASTCRGLDAPMRAVWSSEARHRVATTFSGAPLPYAAEVGERVVAALDRYAGAWAASRVEACRAGERGEQSNTLLDARMRCLDRRLARVAGIVTALVDGDPQVIARAPDAVAAATRGTCDNLEALAKEVPPPEDPNTRQRIAALYAELAAAEALYDVGMVQQANTRVAGIAAEVRRLDFPPLVAELLWRSANLASARRDDAAAEAAYRELTRVAALAKDDRLTVHAWAGLIFHLGGKLQRVDDALALVPAAESALARSGDPLMRATLNHALAVVYRRNGDIDAAERLFRECLAITEEHLGPDAPEVANTANSLALLLHKSGRYDEARDQFQRALTIRRAHYGEGHPRVAGVYQNLGGLAIDRGQTTEARAYFQRAVDSFRATVGERHASFAANTAMLAELDSMEGQHERALAGYRHALEIVRELYPPASPTVLEYESMAGMASLRAGDPDAALAACQRALSGFEALGTKTMPRLTALLCVGRALTAVGRDREAVATLDEAIAMAESISAPPKILDELATSRDEAAATPKLARTRVAP